MLSVKVNKESHRVQAIAGEAIISDTLCASEALRLREKYEQLFSLQLEMREHKGDVYYTISENKKVFFIVCQSMKERTILGVALTDTSKN